jgi:hypothetical protein
MGIGQELSVVAAAYLCGVLVTAVYEVLRVLRRLKKHSLFWISVEDLLYWIWCGFYVFLEIHRTCSGRIRWYYLLGLFLGAGTFARFFQKFLKKRIDKSKKTR